MWLDRFGGAPPNASGSSTPQSIVRSYSPLPRRTTSGGLSPYVTSQRTGSSPRSSSLSLASNDSTSSLLSSSRKPNGSALRQTSTVYDGPSPEDIIEKLLEEIQDDSDQPQEPSFVKKEDLDLIPEFGGLSLRQLADRKGQGESDWEAQFSALSIRSHSVEEYDNRRTQFNELHQNITACDDILNSVETFLTSFRNDLANVSSDIESLQSRSAALNRRLNNRQAVEKALSPIVEELSISPETITRITAGHIDESWVRALSDLDRRATAHQKRTGSQPPKALEDLKPLLEKLILKAIERIRDFLVAQIRALRAPQINAQIIQQQNFLKFKDLFTFLHKHHQTLANEISLAYMNTMRWYYLNQFGRYEKALGKIKLHSLDKNDALGQEDTPRRANVLSAARIPGPPHDAFNLGRRIDILKTNNPSAISSYLAEEDQSTHYLEVPFRNFNLALMDNATAEYTFLATFFSPALSFAQISKNFNYIFDPTFELGRTLSKALVGDTYDAIGILLCIRLNQRLSFELQRRKVPAGEGYINATNMLLWPRLQVIMDRHCESVRSLTNALPTKPSKSSSDPSKMTAAPHMLTQRFGALLEAFLALSTDAGDEEPVASSLRRLRTEVETFLTRQAQTYGSDKRKGSRFLYNNYSLVLTILGDIGGKMAIEQRHHFEKLKLAHQADA
ncbi:unnamed protein product [Clonostachys rosea f. rosea IK726]|uniref:Vps52/Sac2 family protein n=2 Tax=Bionectria ochroleuca TaxID=29856 RepID=A0A0B7JSH6_BIOOC|nr:unnamed protein product [Clonostachys rosea f. rosea IK726]